MRANSLLSRRIRTGGGLYAAALCGLFLLLCLILVPYAGPQNDEALFSSPLYFNAAYHLGDPPGSLWSRMFPLSSPVMVMSYLGSLKSFLYAPILALFGASVWTLRLPVILIGTVTLWLFYRLCLRSTDPGTARIALALLATDPIFLLTNTFDWGPVAIEHLLLVTGCYQLFLFASSRALPGVTKSDTGVRFSTHGVRNLAIGCFCFGLALWNKAIFSWALTGLIAATLLTFPRHLLASLRIRTLAVAAAAFLLGAAPLITYNLRHNFETISQNAHLEPSAAPAKWIQVHSAIEGTSLFGYLAAEEWFPNPKPAGSRFASEPGAIAATQAAIARASAALRDRLGETRRNFNYYALGAVLLVFPLWIRSRAARFALIFSAVTWLMMAMTHDAGASAHHVVLMWPFPLLFLAVGLARIPFRLGSIVAVVLVAMNLAVWNQYLTQFDRNGAGDTFTDALLSLSDTLPVKDLPQSPATAPSSDLIYITDWGIFDSLNLLHRGTLPLRVASDSVMTDDITPEQLAETLRLSDPRALWIGHVPEHEVFQGVTARLDRIATQAGYRKQLIRTVADSNQRPFFELYRWSSLAPSPER